MLPMATQVRKAIWEAVNPHTGKKRIDEAFPHELRQKTRDDQMFIEFKNGSTWQALGSDNYEGAIGSTPAGIVYSEWALAKPSARGFLRPIIAENNGWQIFITTPRGKNHAYNTFKAARKSQHAFAQLLTVDDTCVLNSDQLLIELNEYIDTYGKSAGTALFQQEYYCSFEAAILGAIWGDELSKLVQQGRYLEFDHDPSYPVYVAMDIGSKDATSIWFYQVIANEVRFIDYLSNSFKDVDYYASQIEGQRVEVDIVNNQIDVKRGGEWPDDWENAEHRKSYRYSRISLPHDAKAKRLGSNKTVQEQFSAVFGWDVVRVLPLMSLNDGIKYTRQMLNKAYINEKYCEEGFEALKAYQYQYDEDKHKFKDKPLHNWASDPADGMRYSAMAIQDTPVQETKTQKPVRDAYDSDEDERSWMTC